MDEIKYVTEDEFFKLVPKTPIAPNSAPRIPMTPWVLIQFRTAVLREDQTSEDFLQTYTEDGSYNITQHSTWTTVSFRKRKDGYKPNDKLTEELKQQSLQFNNFFENVELEDNGGLVNCNLKLYDPDFGNLEQIILRSILSMKAANQYYENNIDKEDSYMLQFHSGAPQNINFRLRFGYADALVSRDDIIDIASNETGEFTERVIATDEEDNSRKMVIRSPWKYFQMMDCKFSVSESGMYAEVKGISIGTSVFDRLKIVQRFAMLRGTPELLIKQLGKQLFKSSSGMIQFVDTNGSVILPDEDVTTTMRNMANYNTDSNFHSRWGLTWSIVPEGTDVETWLSEQYSEEAEGAEAQLVRDIRRLEEEHAAHMYRIEVMYGAEPRPKTDRNGRVIVGTTERTYQNIKSLLRNICSKVPPIYRQEVDGEEIYRETAEDVKKIFTGDEDPVDLGGGEVYDRGKFQPVRYSFKTREIQYKGTEKVIVRVSFDYAKPQINKQDYIRKYTWRNNKNNLIKNFSIASEFDFAQMNTNIAIVNDEEVDYYMAPPSSSSDVDNNRSGAPSSTSFDPTRGNNLRLVHSIIENTEAGSGEQGNIERRTMAQQMIDNMNAQVFRGSIEIPGDPFFQFDEAMEPYSYGIYIEVVRDFNYYTQNLNEANEKSYMSGLYVVKKIKHSLGSGGFKTILEVEKWPTTSIKLVR